MCFSKGRARATYRCERGVTVFACGSRPGCWMLRMMKGIRFVSWNPSVTHTHLSLSLSLVLSFEGTEIPIRRVPVGTTNRNAPPKPHWSWNDAKRATAQVKFPHSFFDRRIGFEEKLSGWLVPAFTKATQRTTKPIHKRGVKTISPRHQTRLFPAQIQFYSYCSHSV